MRREPRITTTLTRRLRGRWLAAMLIVGAVALLAPGVAGLSGPAGATGPASPAGPVSATLTADTGCLGVTPAVFPATGFITDPGRTQGGHLWWRRLPDGSICIGTVVEFVQYNATDTKTWRVLVFSTQYPNGLIVKARAFTEGRGWFFWSFGVHQAFTGLQAVCLSATDAFGIPCVQFGQG